MVAWPKQHTKLGTARRRVAGTGDQRFGKATAEKLECEPHQVEAEEKAIESRGEQ